MNDLGSGAGDRGWVRVFAERAPELLAIVLIVGIFVYHLAEVARETNLSLHEINASVGAATQALTALSASSLAEQSARGKEHAELSGHVEQSREECSKMREECIRVKR
jgi:hypothetical protein